MTFVEDRATARQYLLLRLFRCITRQDRIDEEAKAQRPEYKRPQYGSHHAVEKGSQPERTPPKAELQNQRRHRFAELVPGPPK